MEDLESAEGKRIRADVDMLGLISKDDPPVYLVASSRHEALQSLGDVNHTPKHSLAVKKRCDELGVPAVIKIVGGDPAGAESPVEFLLKYLLR